MTRRLNWILVIVLLLIGVPYYWLLVDNRPGDAAAKPVTIAQLRQLASSLPGPRPAAVEMEAVASRDVPGNLFAAGIGLKQRSITVMAFRLPVPGGKPIVIDSGFTRADAAGMGIDTWSGAAQGRVNRAMDEAGLILITHEHPDHIGGMIGWAGTAAGFEQKASAKQRMTAPQAAFVAEKLGMRQAAAGAPLDQPPRAVAPGVVLIPAPSHTPGSQMVFVTLADGREYLFAGDIATLDESWRQLRARSRLVGDYLAPEDRAAVFAWLRTIRALKQAAPGLVVVPGHDADAVLAVDRPSGIRTGFDLPQIKAAAQ